MSAAAHHDDNPLKLVQKTENEFRNDPFSPPFTRRQPESNFLPLDMGAFPGGELIRHLRRTTHEYSELRVGAHERESAFALRSDHAPMMTERKVNDTRRKRCVFMPSIMSDFRAGIPCNQSYRAGPDSLSRLHVGNVISRRAPVAAH